MPDSDLINVLKDIFLFFGLDNPAHAGGWILSFFLSIFTIWRITVIDKKYDEFIDKISKIIEVQEKEWRQLVSRTDDMTFDMLKTSTSTMSVLVERINSLQIMLQMHNNKKE